MVAILSQPRCDNTEPLPEPVQARCQLRPKIGLAIWINKQIFSFKKKTLKMLFAVCRHVCLGLNKLTHRPLVTP